MIQADEVLGIIALVFLMIGIFLGIIIYLQYQFKQRKQRTLRVTNIILRNKIEAHNLMKELGERGIRDGIKNFNDKEINTYLKNFLEDKGIGN